MAVKNKVFSLTSLVIIALIAFVWAGVFDNSKKANMEHEETVNVRSSQSTSKIVPDEKMTKTDKVVEEISKNVADKNEFAEEVDKITNDEVEENTLGFNPIPGEVIPGIDYKKYIDYSKYTNVAIIGTKQYVNIRKGAGEEHEIIGSIQPNGGCTFLGSILNSKNETWAKIESGGVTGFVKDEFLIKDKEALAMVSSVGRLVIKSKCDELNVRESPSLKADILYRIDKGEKLDIISATKDWIEVEVAFGDDSAYISSDFVNIRFELHEASKIEKRTYNIEEGEDSPSSKESIATREALVNYAQRFLGCPYKLGGTSFKTGIDCSAYVQTIYAKFGYSLPRTSSSQSGVGTSITSAQLQPGDLVFYRRGKGIGHVAIYIGNNKIIHASNRRDGIKYSNMNYTTPAKFVRVINK